MKGSMLFDALSERFNEEGFYFSESSLQIEIQGQKEAVNRFGNPPEVVKTAHWFGKYWIYIKITLKKEDKGFKNIPFISICFFQEVDSSLDILFRAEWDNYPLVKDYNHPQPHWHISNIMPTIETLEDLISENDAGDFESLLHDHVNELTDIYKMHFAMAGDWYSNGDMCTLLNSETMIVGWISNLLKHVKKELEYVAVDTE